MRVAGRIWHLRFPDAFEMCLRRTVVNLCTSHFRHARVERAYMDRERGRGEPLVEGPDEADRDELRRALRALPPRQRAAVVLRYYEDLSDQGVGRLRLDPDSRLPVAASGWTELRVAS